MQKEKWKAFWKKFWFIVWKDESLKGWIISMIFILIIIKFIFFPGLSLATGTKIPLAIVESCSMYHQGNMVSDFDSWWIRHSIKFNEMKINKTEFEEFIFKKGFSKGDILFIVKAKPEKLKVGDVIIFNGELRNPIIHRVVNITIDRQTGQRIFSTMGDNNNGQLEIEKQIQQEQLMGKALFRLSPSLGWIKLIFYEPLKSGNERGFCKEN